MIKAITLSHSMYAVVQQTEGDTWVHAWATTFTEKKEALKAIRAQKAVDKQTEGLVRKYILARCRLEQVPMK